MNKLKTEKQEMVLNLLVEGNSIRSVERITGVHTDTAVAFSLRMIPAMAAGVLDKLWDIEDILILLENREKNK